MCGWCCGGVPVERRGSGHKNCSEDCYNAPGAAKVARLKARIAELEGEREALWDAGFEANAKSENPFRTKF